MGALKLEVRTPTEAVLEAEVDELVAPLPDGWIGILPGHAPFCGRVLPGELVVRVGGRDRLIATLGGALMVEGDAVTVLSGVALLDRTLEALEHEISEEVRQRAAMETEAARHFERVYRQVAHSFGHRRGRRA